MDACALQRSASRSPRAGHEALEPPTAHVPREPPGPGLAQIEHAQLAGAEVGPQQAQQPARAVATPGPRAVRGRMTCASSSGTTMPHAGARLRRGPSSRPASAATTRVLASAPHASPSPHCAGMRTLTSRNQRSSVSGWRFASTPATPTKPACRAPLSRARSSPAAGRRSRRPSRRSRAAPGAACGSRSRAGSCRRRAGRRSPPRRRRRRRGCTGTAASRRRRAAAARAAARPPPGPRRRTPAPRRSGRATRARTPA